MSCQLLAQVLPPLRALVLADGGGGGAAHGGDEAPATATAPRAAPTPLSLQVRDIRPSADAPSLSIQRNVCDAFDGFMRRLAKRCSLVDEYPHIVEYPAEFVDQINWCRKRSIIDADLAESLHRLRLWRNAATHHNNERWSREGPSSADEVSRLVAAIDKAPAS